MGYKPNLDINFKFDHSPVLSKEEELEMIIAAKNGNETAIDILVNRNIPIVIKVLISDLHVPYTHPDFGHYVCVGSSAIIKAISKYDLKYSSKRRFYLYAILWIKQYIRRCIYENKNPLFKIPINTYKRILKPVSKYVRDFNDKHGRNPSIEEIEEITKLSRKRIERVYDIVTGSVIYLNSSINSDNENSVSEILTCENNVVKNNNNERNKILLECIDELDDRSKYIILNRFGLNGEKLTLEIISQKFNLTRERIRQLEEHALFKLRRIMDNKGITFVE